jgi:hypothetical protein
LQEVTIRVTGYKDRELVVIEVVGGTVLSQNGGYATITVFAPRFRRL